MGSARPAGRPVGAAAALLAAAWGTYLVYAAILPQLQEAKGIATSALGWFGAVGFLATFVGQAFLAPLADRFPQRRVILAGGLVTAAGLAWFATGSGLAVLLAARCASGLGLGVLSPAVTAAAMRAADRPGRVAGVIQTSISAALALGPMAGALAVLVVSAETTLLVAAGVLVAGLAAVRWLPAGVAGAGARTRGDGAGGGGGPPTASQRRAAQRAAGRALLRTRRFWGAALLGGAFMVAVGAYDTLWSRFLVDRGGSTTLVGFSFLVFAVPFALLAAPAGRFVDRSGPVRAALLGASVMVGAIVAYGLVPWPYVIVGIGLVESCGQAFVSVASTVAVASSARADQQASAQGFASAVSTVLATVSSAAAGLLYAAGGPPALFLPTAAAYLAVLLTGAVLLVRTGPAGPASGALDGQPFEQSSAG